jgi:opacity protein-like surface antigen
MITMKLWIPALFFCVASTSLFGQAAEFSLSGGTSRISGADIGSGYSLDNGFSIGFRLTLNSQRFFGHEIGYAYNRSHLLLAGEDQGGMAIHQGFYDFLAYATPEGKRIRPFATGGVHFSNFVPPGSSASQGGGNTKFGVNYGAGLKVRLTPIIGARVDYRQYLTGKPFDLAGASGKLKQNVISIGLAFLL